MVKRAAASAGVNAAISPHWLRHGQGSHAIEKGAPLHEVQATLRTATYCNEQPAEARFLPFWPGFMGLASLTLHAMRKGRGGKMGLVLEMGSALASGNSAERRMAIKMLWLLAYFTLLVAAWIVYAAMLGI
jgi:hypothetical protein